MPVNLDLIHCFPCFQMLHTTIVRCTLTAFGWKKRVVIKSISQSGASRYSHSSDIPTVVFLPPKMDRELDKARNKTDEVNTKRINEADSKSIIERYQVLNNIVISFHSSDALTTQC